MRVLAFGASITQGFWDTEGGWVARLRRYYDELQVKNPGTYEQPTIFNLGISGDTIEGLLKRFKNETEARNWPDEKYAFIFSIGTNNAVVESSGKEHSTPDEYRKNLESLVEQAQKYSKKIMFVGLASCNESLTTPVSWRDIHYTNERIFQFEKVMREVAEKHQLLHVPIFDALQEELAMGNNLFADGLHPNNKGHELIFQLVRPKLDKLLA